MKRLELYTKEEADTVISFFTDRKLPAGPQQVTSWMQIENCHNFVEVQIGIISTYKPLSQMWICAIERLDYLKKHIEK